MRDCNAVHARARRGNLGVERLADRLGADLPLVDFLVFEDSRRRPLTLRRVGVRVATC